ncbi:hypothetical protein NDU88_004212 [Pleurodeles waltl]|uniref:Uncharacterized protein n=1 Tax=Pleurodeles waltl TaxID=8319 RepID=A0AAV7NRV5_PLEWA|nr:hypothetical protein NDU88_004212 [Pleurodeles waltl]
MKATPGGRGQATEHGGHDLLELCAAPGSSDTTREDRGGISLPEQSGWSLDNSEAHLSRERVLAGVLRQGCAAATRVGPVNWAAGRRNRAGGSAPNSWGRAPGPEHS